MGPLDRPPLLFTSASSGLRWPKLKPTPPPDLWISAASRSVLKMLSMSSSMGSTKQAASWFRRVSAPVHVGVFGMNPLGTSSP